MTTHSNNNGLLEPCSPSLSSTVSTCSSTLIRSSSHSNIHDPQLLNSSKSHFNNLENNPKQQQHSHTTSSPNTDSILSSPSSRITTTTLTAISSPHAGSTLGAMNSSGPSASPFVHNDPDLQDAEIPEPPLEDFPIVAPHPSVRHSIHATINIGSTSCSSSAAAAAAADHDILHHLPSTTTTLPSRSSSDPQSKALFQQQLLQHQQHHQNYQNYQNNDININNNLHHHHHQNNINNLNIHNLQNIHNIQNQSNQGQMSNLYPLQNQDLNHHHQYFGLPTSQEAADAVNSPTYAHLDLHSSAGTTAANSARAVSMNNLSMNNTLMNSSSSIRKASSHQPQLSISSVSTTTPSLTSDHDDEFDDDNVDENGLNDAEFSHDNKKNKKNKRKNSINDDDDDQGTEGEDEEKYPLAYNSALPYTEVRDYAYPETHPLHYGVPPVSLDDDDDEDDEYEFYDDDVDDGINIINNNSNASNDYAQTQYYSSSDMDRNFGQSGSQANGINQHNQHLQHPTSRRPHSNSQISSSSSNNHSFNPNSNVDYSLLAMQQGLILNEEGYPESYRIDGGPPWTEDPDLASPVVTMHSVGDRISREFEFSVASADEIHGRAIALFDFVPENDNEAPLRVGQVIWVSYRHGQGWLVAEDPATGETGLVPEEYVRMLPAHHGQTQQQQQNEGSSLSSLSMMQNNGNYETDEMNEGDNDNDKSNDSFGDGQGNDKEYVLLHAQTNGNHQLNNLPNQQLQVQQIQTNGNNDDNDGNIGNTDTIDHNNSLQISSLSSGDSGPGGGSDTEGLDNLKKKIQKKETSLVDTTRQAGFEAG